MFKFIENWKRKREYNRGIKMLIETEAEVYNEFDKVENLDPLANPRNACSYHNQLRDGQPWDWDKLQRDPYSAQAWGIVARTKKEMP